MKLHSNTAQRNAQDQSHPPLARDGYGNPLAIPDGTAAWRLKRETGGRPKMIVGADRQPARFPLDVTADDIEAMVGAGTYRIYAIGTDGEVLDYVTTVSVGESASTEADPAPAMSGLPRGGSSDLRFALETILQMSRAQSDSLKAMALAQADWVKGLATAKALPRNGYPVGARPPTYRVLDEPERDDDDEEDEDGEPGSAGPPPPPPPPWLEAINAVAPLLQTYGEFLLPKRWGAAPAAPEAPRNAAPEAPTEGAAPVTAPPNPMVHLSEINARLTALERKFLNIVLRAQEGGALAKLLLGMSVDEAAAFVKEQVARVQSERNAPAPGAAAPGDAPPADATPGDVAPAEPKQAPAPSDGALDFMSHVLAGSAYLTAEERATVMWLLPRVPAARLEALKAKLLQMTPRDGAQWLREHLAALRAEVSS